MQSEEESIWNKRVLPKRALRRMFGYEGVFENRVLRGMFAYEGVFENRVLRRMVGCERIFQNRVLKRMVGCEGVFENKARRKIFGPKLLTFLSTLYILKLHAFQLTCRKQYGHKLFHFLFNFG